MMNQVYIERLKLFFQLVRRGYVNPKKLVNIIKCVISELSRNPKVSGQPFSLILEPTNYCNLKCPVCPTGNGSDKRKKGFLSFDNFKKVIDDMSPYLVNLLLCNFGEPLLHKELNKMIAYAKRKNLRVITESNGHFFRDKEEVENFVKSGLDKVIIAIDGTTQNTLAKYRINSKLEGILNGIDNLVKTKKRLKSKYPLIEIQFIIMKHNQHEIKDIEKLCKKLKVDRLRYKTFNMFENYSNIDSGSLLPKNKNHSRYIKDKEGKFVSKIELDRCSRLWFSTVINWDGTVLPCCQDGHCVHKLGNFFEAKSFKNIWNGKRYIDFRNTFLKHKSKINICKNCAGDRSTTIKEINFKV